MVKIVAKDELLRELENETAVIEFVERKWQTSRNARASAKRQRRPNCQGTTRWRWQTIHDRRSRRTFAFIGSIVSYDVVWEDNARSEVAAEFVSGTDKVAIIDASYQIDRA